MSLSRSVSRLRNGSSRLMLLLMLEAELISASAMLASTENTERI
jgi:hypothetical protein